VPSSLVFGATGAIGQFLLPKLRARDEHVVAASRQPRVAATDAGIEWLHADLFATMPEIPAVETIFSVGPLDAFAKWFAQDQHGGGASMRRVIAISSMSAQSKQDSIDPAERALSTRLREAEQTLFDVATRRKVACTIFRPTLIYGSGRDRSLAPLARFARRWRVLPIPHAAHGLRQPVHADDLAAACVATRDAAVTFGRTYELGGGERLRFDAMLARIAMDPQCAALRLPVPLTLLRVVEWIARGHAGALSRLQRHLLADNAAAARDFAYAPRTFDARAVLPQ
jgi:nucleoside-diphosphate-sugar epimerase